MACVHPYLIDPYPRCMKRNKKNKSNSNHWWQDVFVYMYMYDIYLYIYTCIYICLCIYTPVYNVSIYTSLHATTTIIVLNHLYTWKIEKKNNFENLPHPWPHLLGRRLADANKEKVKITGKPEVMSPRTFQITDKDIFFQAVQIPHAMRRVGGIYVSILFLFVQRIVWERKKREMKTTRTIGIHSERLQFVYINIYTYVFICVSYY